MIRFGAHPVGFVNEWFTEPIVIIDPSVAGVIDALNRHPLFDDQTAQDYVMPIRRRREHAGRFRIYGENQDTYYRVVYEGDESMVEPPVYYESCLLDDHGIDPALIIDGDHVLRIGAPRSVPFGRAMNLLLAMRHTSNGNGRNYDGLHSLAMTGPCARRGD